MLLAHHRHTTLIKDEAKRLGFDACGIADAVPLDEEARRLEQWLNQGHQAGMHYMERNFDLRINPSALVPGAKSVITLLMNYYPSATAAPNIPKVAKYAWGTDYHFVIREKLNSLLAYIQTHIGLVEGRGFVDSAPVLERAWAVRSGLGWVGKNANLLTKQAGSFFFISTLITDLRLVADPPFTTDHCGTCTRCIDACPTDAIVPNRTVDANKCISYLTIELKDDTIPSNLAQQMNDWLFGCDICQDVCPWNRFAQPHQEPQFTPVWEALNLTLPQWEALGEEQFNKTFKNSPLKRAKWRGIMRNLKAISPNTH